MAKTILGVTHEDMITTKEIQICVLNSIDVSIISFLYHGCVGQQYDLGLFAEPDGAAAVLHYYE